jgi:hypothetical protein
MRRIQELLDLFLNVGRRGDDLRRDVIKTNKIIGFA